MSGVVNLQRRLFGFSPEGRGEHSRAQNNMGRNRQPYYGTAAQAMLGDVKPGSPKGARMMTQYLEANGTDVPNNKKQRKAAASSAGQLLGGGG